MSQDRSRARSWRSGRRMRLAEFVAVGLIASVGLLSAAPSRGDAAEDRPAPAAEAAPVVPAATAAGQGQIDFVGRNIFGRARGTFSRWRVVRQSVDLAHPEASEVVVEVDLASLDTGNADRDEHLRTADFFDVAAFPVAIVRGHSARPVEPPGESPSRYTVRFDVDLHGVKKSIEGELEIMETDPVVVEGGFVLRRTDFGIGAEPSAWNPMSIEDEVPVHFRIAFE